MLSVFPQHIFPQYTNIMQPSGSYWDTVFCLTWWAKHWQMLDYFWLFILNSLCTFFHQLKQHSLLSVIVLMFDRLCPFFTSYEQKSNLALAHSVPRYFNFSSSFFYRNAKETCIWGRMKKGLGQKNPFIESNLFHLQINKYRAWGIAIPFPLENIYGKVHTRKKIT